MRKSKADFLELIGSGEYCVVLKKDDHNHVDIAIRREDGRAAEVHNYPYRTNQIPAYILRELLEEGYLEKGETDAFSTVFRATEKARTSNRRAA
jgi:hypothetical protein